MKTKISIDLLNALLFCCSLPDVRSVAGVAEFEDQCHEEEEEHSKKSVESIKRQKISSPFYAMLGIPAWVVTYFECHFRRRKLNDVWTINEQESWILFTKGGRL